MITDAELAAIDERPNWECYLDLSDTTVDALITRLRAAEAVVAWYGDVGNWIVPYPRVERVNVMEDYGERARAHLAAVRGEGA